MENISLPISGQYVEAVETAKGMMFRLAFTEYHPEPLTYEEIQAIDTTLLRLNDAEVYNEFVVQGVDLSVFRRVFHEILTDPHNTEDWQNVTEPLYFNEERFVKRLKDEGKDNKYIQFYIEQLYKLQATIMERTECVRRMATILENPNHDDERVINEEGLKKYFIKSFFGSGMNTNHWALDYLPSIRKNRQDIDIARIALLTYKSNYINRQLKPSTFAEFYKAFCNLLGGTFHSNYKPSKLTPTKQLEREFYYL